MNELRVPVLHVFLTPWSFLSRHRVAQRPSVLHGRQFNEFLLEICKNACPNGSRYCNFLLSPRVLGHDTLQTLGDSIGHSFGSLVRPLVRNRALNGSTMYPSISRNQLVFVNHVYNNYSGLLSFNTKWLPVRTTVFRQLFKSDFTLPAKQKLTSQIATSKQKQTMEVVHNSA